MQQFFLQPAENLISCNCAEPIASETESLEKEKKPLIKFVLNILVSAGVSDLSCVKISSLLYLLDVVVT